MLPWFVFAFMEAKSFQPAERRMATQSEELTERYFSEVCERAHCQGLLRPGVPKIFPVLIKPLIKDWYVKRQKYRRRVINLRTYVASVQAIVTAMTVPGARAPQPSDSEVFYD